jgi:hypothetical protein
MDRVHMQIASYGAPAYYQTATSDNLCYPTDDTADDCSPDETGSDEVEHRLAAAVELADAIGVNSIEFPDDYWKQADNADPSYDPLDGTGQWIDDVGDMDEMLEANDVGPMQ